jgi:hypothetical protein
MEQTGASTSEEMRVSRCNRSSQSDIAQARLGRGRVRCLHARSHNIGTIERINNVEPLDAAEDNMAVEVE